MINAKTLTELPARLTTRMIIQSALARGWQVELYTPDSAHLRLQRPDGKQLEIYSSIPPTTSLVSTRLSNDKYITYNLLQEAGLPVLPTYQASSLEQATQAAQEILASGKAFVVKPLDASHGNGVSVNLQSIDHLAAAFKHAQQFSETVIVQTYQSVASDIRVVCINYAFVAALERIPARVCGDGVHTIGQLIEQQNQSPQRGEVYTAELGRIPLDRAQAFLGEKITNIPPKDTWVHVLGTANVGTGGETRDVTNDLPDWLKKQAEQAARALQLPVCGVDFLAQKAPEPTDSPESLGATITELNKGPSLFIHEKPNHGKPQPVLDAFFAYLATL